MGDKYDRPASGISLSVMVAPRLGVRAQANQQQEEKGSEGQRQQQEGGRWRDGP